METALIRYLKSHPEGDVYYGKVLEIAPIIKGWLNYIPQTFPHYTRHTIEHSEKIIEQLSLLLFEDPSAEIPTPVIKLSAIEAYLLICVAYLHDAGMVVSDHEKEEIIQSDEWNEWITEGAGSERYKQLKEFSEEKGNVLKSEKIRFVYNRELRFLIAEYIRVQHHLRAGHLIEIFSAEMGRFDFCDPILRKTIGDICVAHGLEFTELEDKSRFPENRTIRGEQANVKLLAILFRLGDLLDMEHDRACPLLMSAANPIPPDSKPHWDQYNHIVDRSIVPGELRISAECNTQDEHRVLQDWCSWIERESKNAAFIVPRMNRHNEWISPSVEISIKPSKTAKYLAEDWKFIFDEESIVRRLVDDIHSHNYGFLDELIQNALDATRCRLYKDLYKKHGDAPLNPWVIDEGIREKYPLKIKIEKEEKKNYLTNKNEEVLVISVEDSGIGMSNEIIKKYFLQIGRSYYKSREFLDNYIFQPISRYGIGFLSVFSISEYVEVETHKEKYDPIKIILRGPRNYLLLEKSERTHFGTTVKVYLNPGVENLFTDYLIGLCSFVEFPVFINNCGKNIVIRGEKPGDITYEIPDVVNKNAKYKLLDFPISSDTMYGSFYVLAYVTPDGEDWNKLDYIKYRYRDISPTATVPEIPNDLIAYNGMSRNRYTSYDDTDMVSRVDVRGKLDHIGLDKKNIQGEHIFSIRHVDEVEEELNKHRISIIARHIKETSKNMNVFDLWNYKQRLAVNYSIKNFWETMPGTIRLHSKKKEEYISTKDFDQIDEFSVLYKYGAKRIFHQQESFDEFPSEIDAEYWIDTQHMHSNYFRKYIFQNRSPYKIQFYEDGYITIWRKEVENEYIALTDLIHKYISGGKKFIYICRFDSDDMLSKRIFKTVDNIYDAIIANTRHPFVSWLVDLSNSLSDINNMSYELDRAFNSLFGHHLNETAFSRYGIDKKAYKALVGFLAELENMPDFPSIRKAPCECIESICH